MDIFTILKNLQLQRDCKWIKDLDDRDIQPFIIQKWLSMHQKTMYCARWLNRYTFNLQPKQYLMLAWSVIKKTNSPVYIKYIKKGESEVEKDIEVWTKIRKHLALSDNDFKHSEKYLLKYVNDNKVEVFKGLGISKKLWKMHGLDFKDIKSGEKKIITKKVKGLDKWF